MSLKEIAKMAGTSISTVSRVLNDPEHRCANDELRKKIWMVAREQGYVVNESARNLKKGIGSGASKVYYIDVLMTRSGPNETDVFYNELFRILETELHRHNCILSAVWHQPVFSDDRKCGTEDIQRLLKELEHQPGERVDGLIILGKCSRLVLQRLKKKYRALISVSRNSCGYEADEVVCDGFETAKIAVDYLIGLGHRRIGYVGECHEESRYMGYQRSLFEHNLSPEPGDVIEAKHTEAEGYAVMKRLSQLPDPVRAIYCATDSLAIGMLKYLNHARNRFYTPSIIGSDDIDASRYTIPMLTTVHVPKEEMARSCVKVLLDRICSGHQEIVKVVYGNKLMVRQSCAPVEESYSLEYYI